MVFFTWLLRVQKKLLKIFWSADTMEKIISKFNEEKKSIISLDAIKEDLQNN